MKAPLRLKYSQGSTKSLTTFNFKSPTHYFTSPLSYPKSIRVTHYHSNSLASFYLQKEHKEHNESFWSS